MKKIIISVFAVLFCFGLTSCNQNALDIEQKSVIDLESFYANATDDDALQLIAPLYHFAYTQLHSTLSTCIINCLGDDDYSATDLSAGTNVFHAYTFDANEGFVQEMYSHYFTLNYLANLILEKMPSDTPVKQRVHAEAKVFRAYAYLQLIRFWGTPPLVDHLITADAQIENGKPEELWKFVFDNLNEAATVLPSKGGMGNAASANIRGRITKEACYALLGKAQLYSGDYAAARQTLADKVIGTNFYELIPAGDLYHTAADFSDEYIWEYNSEDSNSTNYTAQGNRQKASYYGWRTDFMRMPTTLYQTGYGFGATSGSFGRFMDEFDRKADGSKSDRYKNTIVSFDDLFNGEFKVKVSGAVITPTKPEDVLWAPPCPNCGGYFRLRDVCHISDMMATTGSTRTVNKANYPHIRYAEVLLLYAEACIQTNTDKDKGLAALNLIRTRAGIPTLPSYTLDDVKKEKRAEMYWEGERFLDLVRWGDAASVLGGRGKTAEYFYGLKDKSVPYDFSPANWDVREEKGIGSTGYQSGKNELLPFPATEFYTNKALEQNPGYGKTNK